jgi:hypothetical protein
MIKGADFRLLLLIVFENPAIVAGFKRGYAGE